MAEKRLIFLTGVGRSGTTVLQSMLHAHSQIHFPPETHFFKRYILPCLLKNRFPSPQSMAADPYLQRLPAEKQQWLLRQSFHSLEDLREALQLIMDAPEAMYTGDKDTEYVRYLPHLQRLFPQAYFIHIMRDPRDVVVSRTKTEWGSKRSLAFHVAEYQYYIGEVSRLGPRLFGERFLELRYEDLLEQPEKQLSHLLQELGLQFEPQMLEFHKNSRQLIAEDEKGWKQNLNKPLMKLNRGKWKESLSPSQAALVQNGIEDFMKTNQYELVEARVSPIDLMHRNLVSTLFKGKTFKERLR